MSRYVAWRFINDKIMFVGSLHQTGDRYGYVTTEEDAAYLSEQSAKAFCTYMRECSSVGFYSPRSIDGFTSTAQRIKGLIQGNVKAA